MMIILDFNLKNKINNDEFILLRAECKMTPQIFSPSGVYTLHDFQGSDYNEYSSMTRLCYMVDLTFRKRDHTNLPEIIT